MRHLVVLGLLGPRQLEHSVGLDHPVRIDADRYHRIDVGAPDDSHPRRLCLLLRNPRVVVGAFASVHATEAVLEVVNRCRGVGVVACHTVVQEDVYLGPADAKSRVFFLVRC